MKMRIIGGLVGVLMVGQAAMADTNDSNHVQIVVNQEAPKKVVKKPLAKTMSKKVVAKKVTKPARPRQAVVANGKKPLVKKVAVVPVKNTAPVRTAVVAPVTNRYNSIPGKRVSLANSNAARANGYTSSDPTNPTLSGGTTTSTTSPLAPSLATKIKQEENKETESAWSLKWRTYNAMDLNALENYGPSRDYTVRAWERVNIDYHFNSDISLGVMPQYFHTWFEDQDRSQSSTNPGLNQSYASYLGDTGILFNDKAIGSFGGTKETGFVIGGRQEYYAPTSEASQTAGSAGETRTALSLAKSFGKLDLKWTEEFRYYFQQYTTNAYLNSSTGQPIQNTQYRLLNLLDVSFNITSKLSLNLETGAVNESDYGDLYSGGGVPQTYIDYLVMNPDITYQFIKNLGLSFGIWEVYNYTNPPTLGSGSTAQTASYTPFAPYNGNTIGSWAGTEVYLMGTLKF